MRWVGDARLDCDIYVTSLHKWLSAPHGTGFLYIRKELIPTIWPMYAVIVRLCTV